MYLKKTSFERSGFLQLLSQERLIIRGGTDNNTGGIAKARHISPSYKNLVEPPF